MSLNLATPDANPRLGSRLAIFASLYVSLGLFLVIAEQLGVRVSVIDQAIIIGPLCLYALIGVSMRSGVLEDFFVSGQRVPPLYVATTLCAATFGGSIVLGSIGTLFFIGIDAIAIPMGVFTGLVLMGLLLVPFLRKAGARTLPGFLYLRFGRFSLRAISSIFAIAPCFLLLLAEVAVGVRILEVFLRNGQIELIQGLGPFGMRLGLVAVISLTVLFGGMRSGIWTSIAQFIVFLGILAPLTIVSVERTNLPLPQLTYGAQLEQIKALEAARDYVTVVVPRTVEAALPSTQPAAVVRPNEKAFSALSPVEFLLLLLSIAMGVASFPALLPKLSTTQTVQATRRAMGWTVALAGFVVLTIPAYAFFAKAMAIEGLVGVPASDMPGWAPYLNDSGIATFAKNQFDQLGTNARVLFQRDTASFILPVSGFQPHTLLGVAGAAMLAAVCACASSQLLTIGNMISDDLIAGRFNKGSAPGRSIQVSRAAILACAGAVVMVEQTEIVDPLREALYAFALSGGTFFPAMILSVWWRRLSAAGAMAGLIAGFGTTSLLMLSGTSFLEVEPLTAGALGVPVGIMSSMLISLLFGEPDEKALEAVDELRIPAGETLQSRMARLASRAKPKAA